MKNRLDEAVLYFGVGFILLFTLFILLTGCHKPIHRLGEPMPVTTEYTI